MIHFVSLIGILFCVSDANKEGKVVLRCKSQVVLLPCTKHFMQFDTHGSSNSGRKAYILIQVEGGTLFDWGIGGTSLSSKGRQRDSPFNLMGGRELAPVYCPVCAAIQNSERFEDTTQVLPSVHRTAGPISHEIESCHVNLHIAEI